MMSSSSISSKIIWLNVLVCTLALVVAAAALLIYDRSSFRQTLLQNVKAQTDVIAKNSAAAMVFEDPDVAFATLSALDAVPNIHAATIFRPDGAVFVTYKKPGEGEIRYFGPDDLAGGVIRTNGAAFRMSQPIRSGERIVGYIVVDGDFRELNLRLRRYATILAAVLFVSLVLAVVISTGFRRAVVHPILALAGLANVIYRERKYSLRAEVPRTNDELTILVRAFNEMLSGIEDRDSRLQEERSKLKAILEHAPVGVLVLEVPSMKMVLANHKFEEILREKVGNDISYAKWEILTADREAVSVEDRPLTRASRGEHSDSEEYLVKRSDGSEIWVRASAAPILNAQGSVAAALLVIIEIDEQKKAHEALLQSEKLAAAGRLAASISHEINNPLESVTNLLFLSLNDPSLTQSTRRYLSMAEEELRRVTHIATQTLRFYRQSSNPTSVQLENVVDAVLALLVSKLRNGNVEVIRSYHTYEPIVCFEGELRQVFTNFISNAIDATAGKKGCIEVRTRHAKRKDVDGIQVTIADNGIGMSREVASKIFLPFYTTKGNQGTGLGLWVSKEIITKHNAVLRVKSREGRGTVFVLFFPFDGVNRAISKAGAA